jgi:hypothetical protein
VFDITYSTSVTREILFSPHDGMEENRHYTPKNLADASSAKPRSPGTHEEYDCQTSRACVRTFAHGAIVETQRETTEGQRVYAKSSFRKKPRADPQTNSSAN